MYNGSFSRECYSWSTRYKFCFAIIKSWKQGKWFIYNSTYEFKTFYFFAAPRPSIVFLLPLPNFPFFCQIFLKFRSFSSLGFIQHPLWFHSHLTLLLESFYDSTLTLLIMPLPSSSVPPLSFHFSNASHLDFYFLTILPLLSVLSYFDEQITSRIKAKKELSKGYLHITIFNMEFTEIDVICKMILIFWLCYTRVSLLNAPLNQQLRRRCFVNSCNLYQTSIFQFLGVGQGGVGLNCYSLWREIPHKFSLLKKWIDLELDDCRKIIK